MKVLIITDRTNTDIQSDNYERDIIQPAVNGTTGILTSALKVPTVKRFVITSSLNAVISWENLMKDSDKVWTGECWKP